MCTATCDSIATYTVEMRIVTVRLIPNSQVVTFSILKNFFPIVRPV